MTLRQPLTTVPTSADNVWEMRDDLIIMSPLTMRGDFVVGMSLRTRAQSNFHSSLEDVQELKV